MKRILIILSILSVGIVAKAEVEFAYEAGAEVVSAYLWRGMYNGGLSFQPTVTVGFEHEKVSFQAGVWGSVGASDWKFQQDTYFVPELDVVATLDFFGVHVGFAHYYYFNGSDYFCWKKIEDWTDEDWDKNSSSTELTLGYNFNLVLPEEHNLYVNWNTMVAGCDFMKTDNEEIKQNYSSYLELGYDYTFTNIDLTLGAQIGMVPWSSAYYGNDTFAVTNLSLKLNKAWEVGPVELDLFAQGMMNPYLLNADKESAYINGCGVEKIGCQSLNGTIGLGIWF